MEGNSGSAAVTEGILATVAAIDALCLEDAALATAGAAGASGAGTSRAGPAGDGVDVLQRAYEIRLDRIALASKLQAQAAALMARDASDAIDLQLAITPPDASIQDRTYNEISTVEEIAGVLTISSGAAGAFVTSSRQVCSLPLVLDALATGTFSWQQARIIADETQSLGRPAATALVAHFLDPGAPNPARGCPAAELVPARLRAKVRSWRERHHPESIEKRHTKGVADRRLEYSPDRDGMAWISAYLPADRALAIWNRTTAVARGLQGPHEPRTEAQRRADVFTHQLLTHRTATTTSAEESSSASGDTTEIGTFDPGKVPTPRAEVLVTVPVFALLGLTDEPAVLDGYGPIPPSMARKLVTDGAKSFHRVLVDPRDGAPLETGRTSYRLTKAMKNALRFRDGRCTFPGCNNHTPDNETDHLKAWQHGGTTGISNLAQLCPKHHRLKHHTRWTPTPATTTTPPGWTSPTGRHYQPEHPDWQPPRWPPAAGIGASDVASDSMSLPWWEEFEYEVRDADVLDFDSPEHPDDLETEPFHDPCPEWEDFLFSNSLLVPVPEP